jgi:hypothetical protein
LYFQQNSGIAVTINAFRPILNQIRKSSEKWNFEKNSVCDGGILVKELGEKFKVSATIELN